MIQFAGYTLNKFYKFSMYAALNCSDLCKKIPNQVLSAYIVEQLDMLLADISVLNVLSLVEIS